MESITRFEPQSRILPIQSGPTSDWRKIPLHFYEKVLKVKADVAALHIFFSQINDTASGGVESCQGRRSLAFILTLDRSPRHFILERGTKRNAVQLSFVPSLMGLGFVFVGPATGPHPIFLEFGIAVHKSIKLIRVSQAFPEKPAGATHICPASIRTLNGPLLGLGACWGSI
jgi:hypothetical protein